MKKLILFITTIMLANFTHAQIATKQYNISDVTGIRAGWAYEIEVTEGNSDVITVSAPKETLECVEIKNLNGVLTFDLDFSKISKKLGQDKRTGAFRLMTKNNKTLEGPIKVKMQLSKLNAIILSGSARLKATGNYRSEKMICKLSGAANTSEIKIAVEKLTIDMSGSTSLSFTGSFKDVKTELSGASKLSINGDMVKGDNSLSGASKLNLQTRCNSINFELSGASSVNISGSAQETEIECSGASKFKGDNFSTREAELDLAGASRANIKVIQEIEAELSGASVLTYSGNPAKEKIEKSSGASVNKK